MVALKATISQGAQKNGKHRIQRILYKKCVLQACYSTHLRLHQPKKKDETAKVSSLLMPASQEEPGVILCCRQLDSTKQTRGCVHPVAIFTANAQRILDSSKKTSFPYVLWIQGARLSYCDVRPVGPHARGAGVQRNAPFCHKREIIPICV